jgi:hypothetical protein
MGCNCGRKTLAPAPPPMSQLPQANSRLTTAAPAVDPVNPGNGRVGVGGVITPKAGEAYLGLTPKP